MLKLLPLAAIAGLFIHAPVQAGGTLQQQAQQASLHEHTTWLALGHYKLGAEAADENSSYVDDDSYFLADNGEHSPEAELRATIKGLNASLELADEHPRCRYPARYQWLSEQLGFELEQYPSPECGEYRQWKGQINAHSATLVYAASYLNSPSSMYGHTLLRLDPPNKEEQSEWLSWAVNFGAEVPADDNSMMFAYRGIFGGYPGKFSVLSYLEKVQEYNNIENRDLWEYELNLTPEETEKLTQHLWELKDIQFDYFFFDENCSYRLLELLEYARPGVELTDDFSLFAIPVDTVRSVERAGFFRDNKRRPSKTRLLAHQIEALSRQQRALSLRLIDASRALESNEYASLSPREQAQSVKTASDFLNYRFRKISREQTNVQQRFALLKASSQLPPPDFDELPQGYPPEKGHDSSMWSVAAGREADSDYVDLTWRLSFHDLTDNLPGFDRGSAINMGVFTLRHDEFDDFELQEATLIEIHSFTPRNGFFKPISWETTVGAERVLGAQGGELIFQGNASGGLSYALWDDNITYALLGGRLEYNEQHFEHHHGVALQATVGSLLYSRLGTTQIQWRKQRFDNHYEREVSGLNHNVPIAKNSALVARYQYHHYSDIKFHSAGLEWRQFF